MEDSLLLTSRCILRHILASKVGVYICVEYGTMECPRARDSERGSGSFPPFGPMTTDPNPVVMLVAPVPVSGNPDQTAVGRAAGSLND